MGSNNFWMLFQKWFPLHHCELRLPIENQLDCLRPWILMSWHIISFQTCIIPNISLLHYPSNPKGKKIACQRQPHLWVCFLLLLQKWFHPIEIFGSQSKTDLTVWDLEYWCRDIFFTPTQFPNSTNPMYVADRYVSMYGCWDTKCTKYMY